jgi:ABC-type multidrug transport system ATPase subunit
LRSGVAGFTPRTSLAGEKIDRLAQVDWRPAADCDGLSQAFVARPKVLLCDEPSLGLAMALMPPIMNLLRDWAANGTAVVIVEKHIDLALEIADRALLLERGAFTFAGTAKEFRTIVRAKATDASDVRLEAHAKATSERA